MRAKRALVAGASVAILAWLASCYAATEIQLSIETDVPCETVRARGVAIYVSSSSDTLHARGPVATSNECTPVPGGASVGSLTLVPSGDRGERVFVDVAIGVGTSTDACTADAPGCIIARRAPRYIAHSALRLPVRLSQKCAGVRCAASETCDEGSCVPLDQCGENGCDLPVLEAGVDDAGVADAPVDAVVRDAACDDAACAPLVVIPSIALPSELSIVGDDLYVTSEDVDGGVAHCKTGGCAAPDFLVSQLSRPGTVAADATGLYYSSSSLPLQRCDRPACTNPQRFASDSFSTILVDTTTFHVVSQYNAYAEEILRADGGYTVLTFGNPLAIAADSTSAFFYVSQSLTGNGLLRCPLTGCVPLSPPPTLLSAATDVRSMAVDATQVYWAEADTGRVMRAAKDLASAAVPLTTAAKRPRSLVLDGAFVYWTEEGVGDADGVIMSAAKAGDTPVLIANGQHHPYRLAVAGGRLYWTNRAQDGSVQSAAVR